MRDKSSSITHLVKTVANEEIDKRFSYIEGRINSLIERNIMRNKVIDASDFLEKIQTTLEKAGAPWSDEEDDILIQEIKTAVSQIAKNHNRSKGAIRARVYGRELLL